MTTLKALAELMAKTSEEKIILMYAIMQYHPGYTAGIKRGWSTYTGGMTDTGKWDEVKLFQVSEEELKLCLAELIEESKPALILTGQDLIDSQTPTYHKDKDGNIICWSNVYEDKQREKLQTANFLIWDKQI